MIILVKHNMKDKVHTFEVLYLPNPKILSHSTKFLEFYIWMVQYEKCHYNRRVLNITKLINVKVIYKNCDILIILRERFTVVTIRVMT